jgi:hypothetical protein
MIMTTHNDDATGKLSNHLLIFVYFYHASCSPAVATTSADRSSSGGGGGGESMHSAAGLCCARLSLFTCLAKRATVLCFRFHILTHIQSTYLESYITLLFLIQFYMPFSHTCLY